MIHLTLDGRPVEAAPGSTILAVAHTIGIQIPTLCHHARCTPSVSCMVCVVKVAGERRLLPACATVAREGMVIESECDEVKAARRQALELLLSEHLGDCEGPCERSCPAGAPIPAMLRAATRGEASEVARLAHAALLLPHTLGAICPAPCEQACRRGPIDRAVSIRSVHARVDTPSIASVPPRADLAPVTIVGGGPKGIAAALTLVAAGVAVRLYERASLLGGGLRPACAERGALEILEAELTRLQHPLIELHLGVEAEAEGEALRCTGGSKIRLAVRAIAEGRAAAQEILARLLPAEFSVTPRPIHVTMGRLTEAEQSVALAEATAADIDSPGSCLHCDCRARADCALRTLATELGARPRALRPESRRPFEQDRSHPELILEAGKCILCGRCVALSASEPFGLTLSGRGPTTRITPPLGKTLAEALTTTAEAVVIACPTGALAWRDV